MKAVFAVDDRSEGYTFNGEAFARMHKELNALGCRLVRMPAVKLWGFNFTEYEAEVSEMAFDLGITRYVRLGKADHREVEVSILAQLRIRYIYEDDLVRMLETFNPDFVRSGKSISF